MDKIKIVVSHVFVLVLFIGFVTAVVQSINQSNNFIDDKQSLFKKEGYSENYCLSYYSDYTTKNVPVGCLKYFVESI